MEKNHHMSVAADANQARSVSAFVMRSNWNIWVVIITIQVFQHCPQCWIDIHFSLRKNFHYVSILFNFLEEKTGRDCSNLRWVCQKLSCTWRRLRSRGVVQLIMENWYLREMLYLNFCNSFCETKSSERNSTIKFICITKVEITTEYCGNWV